MRCLPTPLLLLLLLLSLAACGGDTTPTSPLLLAKGGVPAGWTHTEEVVLDLVEAPPGWLCIREPIDPDAWQPAIWPGVRSATVRVPGESRDRVGGGPHELLGPNGALPLVPINRQLLSMDGIEDDSFLVVGDQLMLLDRDGSLASEKLEYRGWIGRGGADDGRVSLHGATGDGFVLLPGERLDLDLPKVGEQPGATLLFSTVCHASPTVGPTTTLQLKLDGELVWSEAITNELFGAPAPWRVELPAYDGGLLSLRVVDGHAPIAVLAPVLTATEVLPAPARPDIVIFLADTFRADNLAAYGGDPRLTPVMNSFAEEALVFESAHAAASWTLPSQATMLSGLHPHQHVTMNQDRTLAPTVPTLAEHLSAAGYRTAAVTDGLFVSQRYGLDAGFEIFLEQTGGKDFTAKTLDRLRGVLELDDGRPLFLFVQTYRVHSPYEVSPESLTAHPELFGEDAKPEDWDFGDLVHSPEAETIEVPSTLLQDFPELRDTMRLMYLGGVADLDHGFTDFLAMLEEFGLEDAALVLTSDHGEAFGEHDSWAHGNSAFEEQLAVPMILRAPGVPKGTKTAPVGLVDLPPTLARLAGLEPDSSWVGRDMLDPGLAPPLLAFEIEGTAGFFVSDDLALYVGDRKVILQLVDGELVLEPVHAFDLASDPKELATLDEASRAWAKELLERYRPEIEDALESRAPTVRLELTEQELSELAAMGYLGD